MNWPTNRQTNGQISLIEIRLDPPTKDLKVFSLLLMPFSIVIGYLIAHYTHATTISWSIAGALFLLGVAGSLRPKTVRWVFVTWMIAAFPIGWTISHSVLAIVFYGLFFPIGLIARCFGYDPLQMRSEKANSYWQDLKPVEKKEQYFRQF